LSDTPIEPDISLPFPIEFLIRDTPRSHQSKNVAAKEKWKQTVASAARARVNTLGDLFYLDVRVLAATIFYFPLAPMEGDVDNIVKLIIDGMANVIYPDDRLLQRVVVQKFEPDVELVIHSLSTTLEEATRAERPVIYIRVDDDLSWRKLP
jgi:Holliday junction resolvase RusA-like endonuclease